VIPVYSLLLVCVLPLSLHTRPRVHWASGIPHALFRADGFLQDSGAARREAAKSYPKLGGNAAAVFAVQQSAAGVEAVAMFVASIRSANLTIFWRCDHPRFSFRRGLSARSGNEPSTVLAENALSTGSGNADSQRKIRSSGWSGRCRPSRRDSGCVLVHPASWRASASYRPLRAVWAVCAWALRGCARSPDPFSASRAAHPAKGMPR